jgi:hypothetical protein
VIDVAALEAQAGEIEDFEPSAEELEAMHDYEAYCDSLDPQELALEEEQAEAAAQDFYAERAMLWQAVEELRARSGRLATRALFHTRRTDVLCDAFVSLDMLRVEIEELRADIVSEGDPKLLRDFIALVKHAQRWTHGVAELDRNLHLRAAEVRTRLAALHRGARRDLVRLCRAVSPLPSVGVSSRKPPALLDPSRGPIRGLAPPRIPAGSPAG